MHYVQLALKNEQIIFIRSDLVFILSWSWILFIYSHSTLFVLIITIESEIEVFYFIHFKPKKKHTKIYNQMMNKHKNRFNVFFEKYAFVLSFVNFHYTYQYSYNQYHFVVVVRVIIYKQRWSQLKFRSNIPIKMTIMFVS